MLLRRDTPPPTPPVSGHSLWHASTKDFHFCGKTEPLCGKDTPSGRNVHPKVPFLDRWEGASFGESPVLLEMVKCILTYLKPKLVWRQCPLGKLDLEEGMRGLGPRGWQPLVCRNGSRRAASSLASVSSRQGRRL